MSFKGNGKIIKNFFINDFTFKKNHDKSIISEQKSLCLINNNNFNIKKDSKYEK